MLVEDVDMARRSLRRRWSTPSGAEVDYSIAATIASRRGSWRESRVSTGASLRLLYMLDGVDRLTSRCWTDRYGPHRQYSSSAANSSCSDNSEPRSDVGGLRCSWLHLPIFDSILRSSAHIRPVWDHYIQLPAGRAASHGRVYQMNYST